MELKVGDWVELKEREIGEGAIGFIEDLDPEDDSYWIIFVTNPYGKRINAGKWKHESQLRALPPGLDENQLTILIDLALKIGDKDWFMELTEQLKFERAW